jgi:hypothetical protein
VLFYCHHRLCGPKIQIRYKSQIHTVKVLPVVWSTQDITYTDREQAWGAAVGAGFGAAAGAAVKASGVGTAALSGAGFAAGMKAGDLASMSTVEAIVYNMNSANIDFGDMLKKRFEEQLAASRHFLRHGSDFGAKNALEYQTQADNFLPSPKPAGVLENV